MLLGVQESEAKPPCSLKFGISSPLQNYYHFNCSRQDSVCHYFNITHQIASYCIIHVVRTGVMTEHY